MAESQGGRYLLTREEQQDLLTRVRDLAEHTSNVLLCAHKALSPQTHPLLREQIGATFDHLERLVTKLSNVEAGQLYTLEPKEISIP